MNRTLLEIGDEVEASALIQTFTHESQQRSMNLVETSKRLLVRCCNSDQSTGPLVVMQGEATGQGQGIGAIVCRHQNAVVPKQILQGLSQRAEGLVDGDQHALTPLLITSSAWALPSRHRQTK